jgi:putative zinc finger protein
VRAHEHYSELCAVNTAGQLSQRERRELRRHLSVCSECRRMLYDFQIMSDVLSSIADLQCHKPILEGTTERFIERFQKERALPALATEEALDLREGKNHATLCARRTMLWLPIAALILITLFLGVRKVAKYRPPVNAQIPVNNDSNSNDTARDVDAFSKGAAISDNQQLKEQLADATRREQAFEERISAYEAQRSYGLEREAELKRRISALEDANAKLLDKGLRDTDDLVHLRQQLDETRSQNQALQNAALVEQAALNGRIRKLTAEIDRQHRLDNIQNTCAPMTARNLHVVDVHDTDSDGKALPAFGRVFYTEGKCLTFYAYDLPYRAINQKVSFYVWGRKGETKDVKNLGMFRSDDRTDGRWVLTVDDPQILTRINTVFVTREPGDKMATRPTGKRFLEAFLGSSPKHP